MNKCKVCGIVLDNKPLLDKDIIKFNKRTGKYYMVEVEENE